MSAQPLPALDRASGSAPANLIANEVARVATRELGPALRALIQTGSLAREEGTFVRRAGRWEVLGDAEFLVVLVDDTDWSGVSALESAAEKALLDAGIACRPEITATSTSYLRGLRPHIFAYELKACGRVLAGDPGILALVPSFPPEEIPLEDGWRLLSNRMVEMLDWPSALPGPGDPLPEAVAYRTIKLCLDAATSLLLFQRAYAPSYRARAERMRQLGSEGGVDLPLPLREFAAVVEELTQLKLDSERSSPRLDWALWRRVVSWAHSLWCFELARLLGTPVPLLVDSSRQLGRRQPLPERVRGWLYVWRAEGWLRGVKILPRITGRFWWGSPRYQLYGAAAELFADLPNLVPVAPQTKENDRRWHSLRRALPLTPPRAADVPVRPAWQGLAADILWNYRRFLLKTRS